ncbi:MAG: aminoacyl-tRNA hydrolase [Kiloniellales bacterium]|nr:aminoacyl-tRNA hydrolase [Kiloniellales bacterium]
MLLLVGLGNPGPKYAQNRHNIGFLAVDEIVRRHGFGPWRARFQGQASEGRMGTQKILVLKPETYMNESGRAAGEALRFYKLEPDEVFVFYDEIDLAPAKLRVKLGGGTAGHNGLRSLSAHIGPDFWRIRLGVGHPGRKELVQRHVLSDFTKAEWPAMEKLIDAVAAELPKLLGGDDGSFMSRVAHLTSPPTPKPAPKADKPEGGDGEAASQSKDTEAGHGL